MRDEMKESLKDFYDAAKVDWDPKALCYKVRRCYDNPDVEREIRLNFGSPYLGKMIPHDELNMIENLRITYKIYKFSRVYSIDYARDDTRIITNNIFFKINKVDWSTWDYCLYNGVPVGISKIMSNGISSVGVGSFEDLRGFMR